MYASGSGHDSRGVRSRPTVKVSFMGVTSLDLMLVVFIFSTLSPDAISKACAQRTAGGQWVQPQWIDSPGGQQYRPSYNLAPTMFR